MHCKCHKLPGNKEVGEVQTRGGSRSLQAQASFEGLE